MANDNGAANLAWFLTGAALGAATALLLAPQTGDETRDYLRKRASEGREQMGRTGREALDRGRELYDRGKELADDASELFDKGREAVKKVRSGEEASETASS